MPPSASKRSRFAQEISAGGVVVKGDEVLVIVPKRRAANGTKVLALPKGHVDGDETAEQAARREVREEGGVDAELLDDLGEVRYTYKRGGRLIDKHVRFFLFRYTAGSPADHDHEIAEARWMTLVEATSALTYAGEREMVSEALSKTRSDR